MEIVVLTLSEQKTYQFIQDFIASHQYAPTAAEIAKGIGIASRGVVHRYLKALEKKGCIRLTPKRHRNIVLIDDTETTIPLVGVIAAGNPIEAVVQNEVVDVAQVFLGPNRYALKVKGDSMIDEGIFDGDLVICERVESARDGQIVVALIDKQEATLKRLFKNEDKTLTLQPANPSHQPQVYTADRVDIQGLYIGLLRLT